MVHAFQLTEVAEAAIHKQGAQFILHYNESGLSPMGISRIEGDVSRSVDGGVETLWAECHQGLAGGDYQRTLTGIVDLRDGNKIDLSKDAMVHLLEEAKEKCNDNGYLEPRFRFPVKSGLHV